jgi:FixJ family two-component response regulator
MNALFEAATGRPLETVGYWLFLRVRDLISYTRDEEHPSCILLDVRIPGLSGPELKDGLARTTWNADRVENIIGPESARMGENRRVPERKFW